MDIARNAAKAATPKVKFRKLIREKPKVKVKVEDSKPNKTDLAGCSSSKVEAVDDAREKPENVTKENFSEEVPDISSHKPQQIPDEVDLLLPDVPLDMDSGPADSADTQSEDIDAQIRHRLTRLQFFSKNWAQNAGNFSNSSPAEAMTEPLDNIEEVAKASESTAEVIPVVSTEQDRLAFNSWYYATINSPMLTAATEISKNIPSQSSSAMVSTSEQYCDKVINSLTSDPYMTSSTFTQNSPEEGQQQLLGVITSLCMMQASVVAMLMSATHILDKLYMASKGENDQSTNTSSHPLVTQPTSEDYLPALEQVEPGPGGVQVTSVTSAKCLRVIPWKRKGLVYTKLF